MNGITHFLVGIVIVLVVWHFFSDEWAEDKEWARRKVFSIKNRSVSIISILRIFITSIAAFFSHAIVDGFAIFTYHPWWDQYPLFNQISKPLMLIAAAIVAFFALNKDIRYAWGIIFSAAFDLWDFSTLNVIMTINPEFNLSPLYLHRFEWAFIDIFLSWAPNFYQEPLAILVEVVIIVLLLISWVILMKKWPLPENKQIQPRFSILIILYILFALWFALDSII